MNYDTMSDEDLLEQADMMEAEIEGLPEDQRLLLHRRLHALLDVIRQRGLEPPPHLCDLDHDLLEEEIEGQFDNMPV